MLTKELAERYSRNIALSEVGTVGQEKLLSSKVLVVGAGGLGSPVLLYLTFMGIGHIGIIDGDLVGYSNLNRQVLYGNTDLGLPKAKQAAIHLKEKSPHTEFRVFPEYLTAENAAEVFKGYDVVVDCLDNFPARFLLNDTCLEQKIPFVHAGVYQYAGQMMTVIPGKTPCLRCLIPGGAASTPEQLAITKEGILGTTPGVFGVLQAMEVFKLLLGLSANTGELFYLDGLHLETEKIPVSIDPDCICQK